MTEASETFEKETPAAILVSVFPSAKEAPYAMDSLNELEGLLKTAGGEVFAKVTQQKDFPDKATYIGSGKVEEVKKLIEDNELHLIVFDCELSPSQIRNLESAFGDDVRVIDRTMLILDIFALHAKTGEGILQVEIAHLKYTIPRLSGQGKELSRLGGGIGTRGPGESKLETDRRHLRRRIMKLEADLKELESKRTVQRSSREKNGMLQIALAGYTNVGKSTLLNRLTDAGILAEDKLFATLDPTTRRFKLPNFGEVLLTDTVGFINNLPHHLIEAFRSTLDEVVYADIILVLLDASDENVAKQYYVTEAILSSLFEERGQERCPVIYVFNKIDAVENNDFYTEFTPLADKVFVSAKTGEGVESLIAKIECIISSMKKKETFLFPYDKSSAISRLYKTASVLSVDYEEKGIRVVAHCEPKISGQYSEYILKK